MIFLILWAFLSHGQEDSKQICIENVQEEIQLIKPNCKWKEFKPDTPEWKQWKLDSFSCSPCQAQCGHGDSNLSQYTYALMPVCCDGEDYCNKHSEECLKSVEKSDMEACKAIKPYNGPPIYFPGQAPPSK